MESIQFFSEEIEFTLYQESIIRDWLHLIAQEHHTEIDTINYVFCSDDYLLNINKQFLDHDYYTDIVTFDNSEENSPLLSDIFISIDRVKDNAHQEGNTFENELYRVLAHGMLHLLGFNDKSDDEQILMRQKEDACLSLLKK